MTKPKPKATKAQLVASQRRLIKAVNLLATQIREQRLAILQQRAAIAELTRAIKPAWEANAEVKGVISKTAVEAYLKKLNPMEWR